MVHLAQLVQTAADTAGAEVAGARVAAAALASAAAFGGQEVVGRRKPSVGAVSDYQENLLGSVQLLKPRTPYAEGWWLLQLLWRTSSCRWLLKPPQHTQEIQAVPTRCFRGSQDKFRPPVRNDHPHRLRTGLFRLAINLWCPRVKKRRMEKSEHVENATSHALSN